MKYRSSFLTCSLFSAALLIQSCGNKNEDMESNTTPPTIDSTLTDQRINTQNVFYNIPSPVETAALLKEVGVEYDVTWVNDPASYKTYNNEQARALNLGVYGADLSFAGLYENSHESMSFLKCVNYLSNNLGIAGVFDEKTVERLEKNKNVKDSILSIVSNSFWDADAYLKENQRPNTSTLIVTGGWLEGMFIACRVYDKGKNPKIRARLISSPQKSSLNSLVSLINLEKQSADCQFIVDGLKKLQDLYAKIPDQSGSSVAKTDSTSGEVTIGAASNEVKVDEAIVTEIVKTVMELRGKVVSFK